MTRCPHCKKLVHSEDLFVEFNLNDFDKIVELQSSINWIPPYENNYPLDYPEENLGKLKCGDIYINFIAKKNETS